MITLPNFILADEPTENLRSALGQEIMNLFTQLNDEGATIVQVTPLIRTLPTAGAWSSCATEGSPSSSGVLGVQQWVSPRPPVPELGPTSPEIPVTSPSLPSQPA